VVAVVSQWWARRSECLERWRKDEIKQEIRPAEDLWVHNPRGAIARSGDRTLAKRIRWDLPADLRLPVEPYSKLQPRGGYLIQPEHGLEVLVSLAGSYCQP